MTFADLPLSRAVVDRAAHRRTDEAWIAAAWADERTRVLVVSDGEVVLDGAEPSRPLYCSPVASPAGERFLLGVDGEVAVFAVSAADGALDSSPTAGLRELGTVLGDRDVGLVVQAIALANWHSAHPCCARCGAATAVVAGGHVRRCPVDGSEHFPRTDPAVIMAVVDPDERLLLARQARWPERRFSTLAGFVEPGESLEQAVRREVREEVDVEVGEVTYLGSQPWPFPSSLMLGFTAEARTTQITCDGVEIEEAAWFSRADLAHAVASSDVRLPPPSSIARRLIEHFAGGPLPDPAA